MSDINKNMSDINKNMSDINNNVSNSNVKEKKKFTDMIKQKNEEKQKNIINEKDIDDDLNKNLNALKDRASQLEDHLRRAVADNENVKRIMEKQISNASDYAVTEFARDMIESCDNLKRAMENLKDDDPVHEGIKVVYQKIMNDLKKHGIEEINPIGKLFNSNLHQTVLEKEDDEKEAGTIIEVLQTGYIIKDRLLRPAMVIISRKNSIPINIKKENHNKENE